MLNLHLPADGSSLPIRSVPKWQFFLLSITLLCLGYAVYSRHWMDFLLFAPLFGIQVAIGSYLAIALRLKKGDRPKFLWVAVIGPVLLTYFVGVVYYSAFVTAKDSFLWLDPKLTSQTWRALFTGLAVIFVGTLLYWVRVNFRFTYGFHEVMVGAAIAAYHAYRAAGVPSSWDSTIYFALVTAGVYLVVRGYDNMHVGITKEPYDAVGRDIFRDMFDVKEKPGMVKVVVYPSDIFFHSFPNFPQPKDSVEETTMPRGIFVESPIDDRAPR